VSAREEEVLSAAVQFGNQELYLQMLCIEVLQFLIALSTAALSTQHFFSLPAVAAIATAAAAAAESAATAAAAAESAATAAAAATTAAESAATAAAAAESAATAAAILTRTRFVDDDCATIHFVAVELCNSRFRALTRLHLDESKTARTARIAVGNDIGRFNRAGLAEQLIQILVAYREGEVPYIQFH
jgi:nucleoid-associated protein YgaU